MRAGSEGPQLRIQVTPKARSGSEGYRLSVDNGSIDITAADASGARYALESLAQQAAYEHGILRPLTIEDAPRFGFRGLHLDLARNFHSKAEVLKIVEQMGRYKLNKLHLHLADDEGFPEADPDGMEMTDLDNDDAQALADRDASNRDR